MVLILTRPNDPHTDVVIKSLQKRNSSYFRFDTASVPLSVGLSLKVTQLEDMSVRLLGHLDHIDLGKVTSVWMRRPEPPALPDEMDPIDREFAQCETMHVLQSLYHLLRRSFWISSYSHMKAAECKPLQLALAREAGLTIPQTLITTDVNDALNFFKDCRGEMIYKPLTPYNRRQTKGPYRNIYTNVVRDEDLLRHREQIGLAPCIFQEYVPKRFELRVTVVGRQIFAAEIDSQKSERSKHDWRRYDLENTPYRPTKLPNGLCDRIIKFMDVLGLVFGCLDFVMTPDGEYVFLEVNPNGQWYWVEQLTGLSITESLVDLLLSENLRN